MKTFVAYRFTGEDPAVLEPLLVTVRDTLLEKGIDVYCTFFDEDEFKNKNFGPRKIMDHAFEIIDECDFMFVVLTSDAKSEGLLMEVGYCIAKGIPVVVATKNTVKFTYVPEMSHQAFTWNDLEDLQSKIQSLELKNFGSNSY